MPWVLGLSSDPTACPHALPPGGSLPAELWGWPIWGPVYGCLGAHKPPLEPLLRMHVGPVAGPRVRQSPKRVSAGPRPRGMGLGGRWPRPRLPGPVSEPQCPRLEVGVEAESLMGYCEAVSVPGEPPSAGPSPSVTGAWTCGSASQPWRGQQRALHPRAVPSAWRAARTGCPGSRTPPRPSAACAWGQPGSATRTCAQHLTATSVSCGLEVRGAQGGRVGAPAALARKPPGTQGPLVTPESGVTG